MLPLKDDVPSQSFPLITVLLIAANVAAFLYQASLEAGTGGTGRAATAFVMEFGAVPCRLTGLCVGDDSPAPVVTVFTSMFLHGGLFHIAGNMLYLWIFGDNVEDTLGHLRFLALYILSGVGAEATLDPFTTLPAATTVPAASVLPPATIAVLATATDPEANVVPAIIVLGFWIVVQVLSGLLSYGAAAKGNGGGVAWFAHIGGFVAGVMLLFLFRPRATRRL